MLESILKTLIILGWLGLVLFILVLINTVCGIITNLNEGESFSWKKLFKGLLKAFIFYITSSLAGIAFIILPYINEEIINVFEVTLLSEELLNTTSSIAILSVIISTIAVQGKKAIQGIIELSKLELTENEEKEDYIEAFSSPSEDIGEQWD